MMVVQMNGLATTAPADLVINTYMKWDETYLYIATEVTGDKNGGRLYYGADGDNLALYLDVDGIAANNGNTDCHTFMVYSFPVVASAGSSDATGYHTRYNQADHEGSPDKLVQTDAGCSGSGTGWIIEQRKNGVILTLCSAAPMRGRISPLRRRERLLPLCLRIMTAMRIMRFVAGISGRTPDILITTVKRTLK